MESLIGKLKPIYCNNVNSMNYVLMDILETISLTFLFNDYKCFYFQVNYVSTDNGGTKVTQMTQFDNDKRRRRRRRQILNSFL